MTMLNKIHEIVIYLLIVFTITGCAWLEQSEHERIIGDYEVGWNDLVKNRNVSKSIKNCSGCYNILVDAYVYGVGHNKEYIIVKQLYDTSTYFYIIDIQKNEKYGGTSGVFSSLNQNEFDSLREQLNIKNISFDMNYEKKQ